MRPLEHDQTADDWLRTVTFPEEDRRLYTSAPWSGGFRWFRSPNVIPIERWQLSKQRAKGVSKPYFDDNQG